MAKIDMLDRRILQAVQENAAVSLSELAEVVHLSTNACWKRLRRLEQSGYVDRRVGLLNRELLGLGLTAFVAVRTDQHDEQWLLDFAAAIRRIPEVVEFYRMSGEVDYMLKVVCRDIADYDRIYRRVISSTKLRDVSASFAMEQIKHTTELPLQA